MVIALRLGLYNDCPCLTWIHFTLHSFGYSMFSVGAFMPSCVGFIPVLFHFFSSCLFFSPRLIGTLMEHSYVVVWLGFLVLPTGYHVMLLYTSAAYAWSHCKTVISNWCHCHLLSLSHFYGSVISVGVFSLSVNIGGTKQISINKLP